MLLAIKVVHVLESFVPDLIEDLPLVNKFLSNAATHVKRPLTTSCFACQTRSLHPLTLDFADVAIKREMYRFNRPNHSCGVDNAFPSNLAFGLVEADT